MWDERYSGESYAYGTEPNVFLTDYAEKLPVGELLCLGEGEGRNAVYLAGLGHNVTAVDLSSVGLAKAERLAEKSGVRIRTVHEDLSQFDIEPESWDAIVSIFCHLPAEVRKDLHRRVLTGLRHNGVLLLEAYTPEQIEYGTGGPPAVEMMMTLAELEEEFPGMEWLRAVELVRDVREGDFHVGPGAVVQLVGRKP